MSFTCKILSDLINSSAVDYLEEFSICFKLGKEEDQMYDRLKVFHILTENNWT